MATSADPFALYGELADMLHESERLRAADGARRVYEDVIARHDALSKGEVPDAREAEAIRQEAAEYLCGRRPVPPPVSSAELIDHARHRITVFRRLAETGIEELAEGAAAGIAEAEAELAAELRKADTTG